MSEAYVATIETGNKTIKLTPKQREYVSAWIRATHKGPLVELEPMETEQQKQIRELREIVNTGVDCRELGDQCLYYDLQYCRKRLAELEGGTEQARLELKNKWLALHNLAVAAYVISLVAMTFGLSYLSYVYPWFGNLSMVATFIAWFIGGFIGCGWTYETLSKL